MSQYEQYGLRIILEHAHDQENSRGYYVRMVVNPRKVIDPGASYIGIFSPVKSSITELQADLLQGKEQEKGEQVQPALH